MTTPDFAAAFADTRAFVERGIADLCARRPEGTPERLMESMAYSLTAGGKRLRPVLTVQAAALFGMARERSLPMALALEMIHTASLIHDDLPAMDDDVLRRGKPTNHVRYGEAIAILAGDALMAWAFEYPLAELARLAIPSDRICGALLVLANALGPSGICGGQVLDTDDESAIPSDEHPWAVARQKTGVLIRAAVLTGAILAGADGASVDGLARYGDHLGTAFQIEDDILDVTSSPEALGKTPGKDEAQNKRTFVSLFGVDEARALAREESRRAVEALKAVRGDTFFFAALAESLVDRAN
ncbi:MAG TPA: geranyl transferase [Synergistaceae bacterium]|nr:geranyl transferase [Synergistaceae bacterium]